MIGTVVVVEHAAVANMTAVCFEGSTVQAGLGKGAAGRTALAVAALDRSAAEGTAPVEAGPEAGPGGIALVMPALRADPERPESDNVKKVLAPGFGNSMLLMDQLAGVTLVVVVE